MPNERGPIATKANCNPKVTRNRSGNIISSIVSFINCLKCVVVFTSLSSFRLKCCASHPSIPVAHSSTFARSVFVSCCRFSFGFFLVSCTFSSFVIPTGRHILETASTQPAARFHLIYVWNKGIECVRERERVSIKITTRVEQKYIFPFVCRRLLFIHY